METVLPYPVCKHIFPSGKRCHSPALRGKILCYYHARNRTLVDNNRYRQRSVGIPPLDDRADIQIAINEVAAAVMADKISDKKAAKLLYAIQLSSQNLARAKEEQLASLEPVEMYEEIYEETVVSDTPDEERGAPDTGNYPRNYHLPELDNSQTHEYESDPPPPPRKETPHQSPFASHREANDFYKKQLEWHDQFFARKAAESAGAAATPAPDTVPVLAPDPSPAQLADPQLPASQP